MSDTSRIILYTHIKMKSWDFYNYYEKHWEKYDIEINLKLEKISNFESLYNMSWDKLQILWQYLDKHLAKNFIQLNYFLFAFSILFIKKSDRKLCFYIDYQVLNVIMIWN